MTAKEYTPQERLKLINEIFTPTRSIRDQAFFMGRIELLRECIDVIERPGTHLAMYGNRGVGKTSLAYVLRDYFTREGSNKVFLVGCDSVDTYESLWRKVFADLLKHAEYEDEEGEEQIAEAPLLPEESYVTFGASKVIEALEVLGGSNAIFIDEFDRLNPQFNRRLFADTLKAISDRCPDTSIIIVGVGENVTDLIGEHASIERYLIQKPVPEMSEGELMDIITKRLDLLGMTMDPVIQNAIVQYSCGYPHFTHLLAMFACRNAVLRGRANVRRDPDFRLAVSIATREAEESLRVAYQLATTGSRKSLYEQVLWATAKVELDKDHEFRAKDVTAPLSKIVKGEVKIYTFNGHLHKFCLPDRGGVLVQMGKKGRRRYRFKDPRMRAYLLLKYQESIKEPIVGEQGDLFEQQ